MSKKSNVRALRIMLLVTVIFTLIYCFACLTGCTEEQVAAFNAAVVDPNGINKVVADVNGIAAGINLVITQTPVGDALPGTWKLIALIATNAISTIAFAWQKFRTGTIAKKYTVMKAAQAEFALVNPEAEKQLYAINGVERVAADIK